MAAQPGQRVYLVRLALGDGVKNPMSLVDFAARIKRATKVVYDPSALSRLENGKRAMTIEDAANIAAVDPLHRGAAWVAAFPEVSAPGETFGLQRSPSRTVEEELTELAPAAKRAVGGKKRGKG